MNVYKEDFRMVKFEDLGITSVVTNDKLKIEIYISGLVSGFNNSPNNYEELKVKRGKRRKFAEYVAKKQLDESDQDTGETFVMNMFEKVFENIFEGYDSEEEIIQYPEN